MSRRIRGVPACRAARRIGGYWASDGEIDPASLLHDALHRGKEVFLPVIQSNGRLLFGRYTTHAALAANRFGIPEPRLHPRHLITSKRLDVVLTPLVAFDDQGHRLGMGGGYYDRSLAFLHHRERWRKPLLIGLAFEFQRVRTLASRPWDVPLSAVVTEAGVHWF